MGTEPAPQAVTRRRGETGEIDCGKDVEGVGKEAGQHVQQLLLIEQQLPFNFTYQQSLSQFFHQGSISLGK